MPSEASRKAEVRFNWSELVNKYFWLIGLALIGLSAILLGVFSLFLPKKESVSLEIIPAEEETATSVWVDIEGAVEKPGVYQLTADSRVNDLLIIAGGLAAAADRDWVIKNLNLAQKLADGVKIYIPRTGEAVELSGNVAGLTIGSTINLNTASSSQLESLWGIGEKRAEDIINNRPYSSAEELLDKKILPENVYQRIKDQISVY